MLTAKTPLAALLVRAASAQTIGYVGHGLAAGPLVRRPRHDLQLGHRRRALPVRGAEAVGAGVAAADDDDVLARPR